VDTIAARHPVEAYSLRITGPAGESLVYTGDTGPNPALAEFSAAADLLLAEAAFCDAADNPSDLHLSGRDAAQLATTAGVGRLVLTHIPPWIESARTLDDARPHFAGPILLAEPGLRLTI
jgi:ribonuclease BN (tRNA processing enzyme)